MKKTRFGLIGYGAWGTYHARAIARCSDAEVVAIAERSEESRQTAQTDHPQAHLYADYDELLQREELDIVDIILPPHLHYEAGKAVLASGRHLLLEKPMALSLDHCDELIELARSRDRLLAIGHEFRLSSLWAKVKELVDAGAIGEPLYGLIELWRNPYRQGSGGWRYDISRVGNWILEEPIHFFDLARWYFEQRGDPVSVYARANAKRPDHPELQDNFSATLGFPNGAYAIISQTLGGWEHHQVAKLTGTQGALWASWSGAMDRTLHPTFGLKLQRNGTLEDIPITKITGEVYELQDQVGMVIRAIRNKKPPAASGLDGRWSVAMCLKAQESVDTGKLVLF